MCVGKKKAGRVRGPPSANAKCELRKKDRRLFDGLGVFEGQARIEILNCIELFFVNALIDVERVGDYRRTVDGAQAITFFPHLEGFFEAQNVCALEEWLILFWRDCNATCEDFESFIDVVLVFDEVYDLIPDFDHFSPLVAIGFEVFWINVKYVVD